MKNRASVLRLAGFVQGLPLVLLCASLLNTLNMVFPTKFNPESRFFALPPIAHLTLNSTFLT